MTLEEAVATLRGYNEWRRYDGPVGEGPTQPDPKAIGEAIDTICDALERQEILPSDLDEAAENEAWKRYPNYPSSGWGTGDYQPAENWESDREVFVEGFKFGAEWQKEQFEKNRFAHCDKLTKEEYDRETDFATEIIEKEHRQPTFTDAINYGMRVMREQLMKEAVEGRVFMSFAPGHNQMVMADVDLPTNTKVKVIVIKED